jgi:hypothetical protein
MSSIDSRRSASAAGDVMAVATTVLLCTAIGAALAALLL